MSSASRPLCRLPIMNAGQDSAAKIMHMTAHQQRTLHIKDALRRGGYSTSRVKEK